MHTLVSSRDIRFRPLSLPAHAPPHPQVLSSDLRLGSVPEQWVLQPSSFLTFKNGLCDPAQVRLWPFRVREVAILRMCWTHTQNSSPWPWTTSLINRLAGGGVGPTDLPGDQSPPQTEADWTFKGQSGWAESSKLEEHVDPRSGTVCFASGKNLLSRCRRSPKHVWVQGRENWCGLCFRTDG